MENYFWQMCSFSALFSCTSNCFQSLDSYNMFPLFKVLDHFLLIWWFLPLPLLTFCTFHPFYDLTTSIFVKTLGGVGGIGQEGLASLSNKYNSWRPKMENTKLPNLFSDWLLKYLELTWLWDYFRDAMALSTFQGEDIFSMLDFICRLTKFHWHVQIF